jgi:hypothetical protein
MVITKKLGSKLVACKISVSSADVVEAANQPEAKIIDPKAITTISRATSSGLRTRSFWLLTRR